MALHHHLPELTLRSWHLTRDWSLLRDHGMKWNARVIVPISWKLSKTKWHPAQSARQPFQSFAILAAARNPLWALRTLCGLKFGNSLRRLCVRWRSIAFRLFGARYNSAAWRRIIPGGRLRCATLRSIGMLLLFIRAANRVTFTMIEKSRQFCLCCIRLMYE